MQTNPLNNKPAVSIGMPVYNGEKYIREALDSLLAQTFTDFELIISDNCSGDNTAKICQEYVTKNTRVRCIRQNKNIGASANFEFVLNQAKGKYFMWAAFDDYWLPDFILETVGGLEKQSSDVSCGFSFTKYKVVSRILPILFSRRNLPSFDFINHTCKEYRVRAYSSMPFSTHKDNMVYALWKTLAIKEVINNIKNSRVKKCLIGASMNEYALSLYRGCYINKTLFIKKYKFIPPGHILVRLRQLINRYFFNKVDNTANVYSLDQHLTDLNYVLDLAGFERKFSDEILKVNKKNR